MTPTSEELRALVERLESLNWECHGNGEHGDDDTPHKAAAALRLWIAERERADAIEMISKEANESAMKHWPCNNPYRSDV